VVIYFNINILILIVLFVQLLFTRPAGEVYSIRFIILSLSSYQYYACIKKIYIIDIDVYKFQIDNIYIYVCVCVCVYNTCSLLIAPKVET